MHINVFYVNIMIYLITKNGRVDILSVTRLNSRSTTSITNVLISEQTEYKTRGFKITDIHADKKIKIKTH